MTKRTYFRNAEDGIQYRYTVDLNSPDSPEPHCGVYWIITTCWIAIATGALLGVLLWLVLA